MKIYTKSGDKGKTSLFDNSRVAKDSLRVESYGTIDELNSSLGFAKNFVEEQQQTLNF
jgi:cob(I)alamin adenosyltransferase